MFLVFTVFVGFVTAAVWWYRRKNFSTPKMVPKKNKIRNPVFDIPTGPTPTGSIWGATPSTGMDGYDDIMNVGLAREFLSAQDHQWPEGLQMYLFRSVAHMPQRFFICDNSGSMAAQNGHRILITQGGEKKLVSCSRWAELTESLKFHARLAKELEVPTEFRLLNGRNPVTLGVAGKAGGKDGYAELLSQLDSSPAGGTPLCKHIREVIVKIKVMEPALRSSGQRVVLMIATDGESSDGDIVEAMKPLKALPVWVVIKLCTDDEKVVGYWNKIDSELELDMDVLDDFVGEGKEVGAVNNWMTYGEQIHRLREFGVHMKELDMIDESRLTGDEIRQVCSVIFNVPADKLPHPSAEKKEFISVITQLNSKAPKTWSPITQKMEKWINVAKLENFDKPQVQGCVIG